MTVIVTFRKDDVAGFERFESKVGSSSSNRDNGKDYLDLIWRGQNTARSTAILTAAIANPNVIAAMFRPFDRIPLRLIES